MWNVPLRSVAVSGRSSLVQCTVLPTPWSQRKNLEQKVASRLLSVIQYSQAPDWGPAWSWLGTIVFLKLFFYCFLCVSRFYLGISGSDVLSRCSYDSSLADFFYIFFTQSSSLASSTWLFGCLGYMLFEVSLSAGYPFSGPRIVDVFWFRVDNPVNRLNKTEQKITEWIVSSPW